MTRKLQGKITKLIDASTIKVRVERKQRHPIYNKIVAKHTNYLVHKDLEAEAKVGSVVQILEVKPVSKSKTWKLV